jgi:hypothetical protein
MAAAIAKPRRCGWRRDGMDLPRLFAEVRARRPKPRVDYGGIDRRRPPMMIEAKVVEPNSTEV